MEVDAGMSSTHDSLLVLVARGYEIHTKPGYKSENSYMALSSHKFSAFTFHPTFNFLS